MRFLLILLLFLISFKSFAQITVRTSEHSNFYRIVFQLSEKIPYEKIEFKEPPLLVLKFKPIRPINVKKSIKNGSYIKNFEIIKSKEDIKIVLELKESYKYSLFTLNNPYRLVIDIKKDKRIPEKLENTDPIKEIILASLEDEKEKDPIAEIIRKSFDEDDKNSINFASLRIPSNWDGKKKIIVIDPGHGGRDPGAIANGLREKDVNLRFAKALKKILERDPRFKVYLTRNSDRYVSLYKRTIYAVRKKADLFISLHCNSSPSGYGYGTYVYTLNLRGAKSKLARLVERRENRAILEYVRVSTNTSVNRILADLAMSTTMTEGLNFARILSKNLRRVNVFQDIDSANFAVLKTPGIPSVLIEIAYITHPREAKLLRDKDFINRFSHQIYRSIVEYFFKYKNVVNR